MAHQGGVAGHAVTGGIGLKLGENRVDGVVVVEIHIVGFVGRCERREKEVPKQAADDEQAGNNGNDELP